jgi:hypothetical protein
MDWSEILTDGEAEFMPNSPRCERVLVLLGEKWAGKTFQILHMLKDKSLGTNGRVPQTRRVPKKVWLSNERLLYMRSQAPEERWDETTRTFFKSIDATVSAGNPRWNFVCPMRISPAGNRVPGGIDLTQLFINRYLPERVCVAVLHPRSDGALLDGKGTPPCPNLLDIVTQIRALTGCPLVEPMIVDARRQNGLLLPDFFDFT